MHMPPNSGGGNFEPPPAGTHRAICYRVIDLGTQQSEYQGQIKHQRKIMLSWELVDERMPASGDYPERPFTIHQRYTFSSHEKAVLRQHLESWRGVPFKESDFGPGGFDIVNVIGKGCLLTIVHEPKQGKTYANLKGVAKLPKAMTTGTPENATVYLSLEPISFNIETFESLSDGLKETIRKSPEWAELQNPRAQQHEDPPAYVTDGPAEIGEADIPF